MTSAGAGIGFAVAGGTGALVGAKWGRFGWVPASSMTGAAILLTPTRVAVTVPLR